MDMDTLQKLRILAPILDQLPLIPDAECFYEVLSGGLLWTDEVPDLSCVPAGTFEGLRRVLWYRSTLIMGSENLSHADCEQTGQLFPNWSAQAQLKEAVDTWSEAECLFPNWPGFAIPRRSSELRAVYMDLKSKALENLDKMFDS